MKRLEDEVIPILRPMIQGIARPLTRRQQSVLATWAVKTAMVMQYKEHFLFRPIPENIYQWMREENGTPPPGHAVFLGCVSDRTVPRWHKGKAGPEHYVMYMLIGAVVFQVIGAFDGATEVTPAGPEWFDCIWPAEKKITWPSRPEISGLAYLRLFEAPAVRVSGATAEGLGDQHAVYI
jgi:hypothetical protein